MAVNLPSPYRSRTRDRRPLGSRSANKIFDRLAHPPRCVEIIEEGSSPNARGYKDFNEGLEDVVAGLSSICDVNGKEGKLIYSGYDIHDLAENTTFEEVIYLLWHRKLSDRV